MTLKIVNLRHETADIFIDRRSRLGNPFILDKDGSRLRVIHLYRIHLARMIDCGEVNDYTLRTLEKANTAGCWCAPEPCHGHVLAKTVEIYSIHGIHTLKTRAKETLRKARPDDLRLVIERANTYRRTA